MKILNHTSKMVLLNEIYQCVLEIHRSSPSQLLRVYCRNSTQFTVTITKECDVKLQRNSPCNFLRPNPLIKFAAIYRRN